MKEHEKAFLDASNKTIDDLEELLDEIPLRLHPALERIMEAHRRAHNTFVFAIANISEFPGKEN